VSEESRDDAAGFVNSNSRTTMLSYRAALISTKFDAIGTLVSRYADEAIKTKADLTQMDLQHAGYDHWASHDKCIYPHYYWHLCYVSLCKYKYRSRIRPMRHQPVSLSFTDRSEEDRKDEEFSYRRYILNKETYHERPSGGVFFLGEPSEASSRSLIACGLAKYRVNRAPFVFEELATSLFVYQGVRPGRWRCIRQCFCY
jgi:hypothetical protein